MAVQQTAMSDGTETIDANIDVTVTDVNDAPICGFNVLPNERRWHDYYQP